MPIYKQKQKNADGLTRYKVQINYTDSSGKYRQKSRLAYGIAQAKFIERELYASLDSISNSNIVTIKDLRDDYVTSIKPEIRESTLAKKDTIYNNHIKPTMADVKLSELDIQELNRWKLHISLKGLGLTQRQNIYGEFRAMLNYAVKMGYINSNPLLIVGNFKDSNEEHKEMQIYTPDEFKRYIASALQVAEKTNYYDFYVFFNIAYYTGCRKGEIHRLRWSNFDGKTLQIRHSINQKNKGSDVETLPKNKSSIRDIQVPKQLKIVLDEHKARQMASVENWNEDAFICGYYRPLRDTRVENNNKLYADMSNLHHIRIHDFRHSHASVLLGGYNNTKGIPIPDIAKRLGHSNIAMVMKTYAHILKTEKDRALDILDQI